MLKMALFDSFADRKDILGRRGRCFSYCEFYMPSKIYEKGFFDLKNLAILKKSCF